MTVKLYYDPEFVFDDKRVYSNHVRAEQNTHPTFARRQKEIAALVASIGEHGVTNPVIVTIRADKYERFTTVHPGQSRCRACRILGIKTIPALIVDWTGEWSTDLTPIPPCAAKALFTGDIYLHVGKSRIHSIRPKGKVAPKI